MPTGVVGGRIGTGSGPLTCPACVQAMRVRPVGV